MQVLVLVVQLHEFSAASIGVNVCVSPYFDGACPHNAYLLTTMYLLVMPLGHIGISILHVYNWRIDLTIILLS